MDAREASLPLGDQPRRQRRRCGPKARAFFDLGRILQQQLQKKHTDHPHVAHQPGAAPRSF